MFELAAENKRKNRYRGGVRLFDENALAVFYPRVLLLPFSCVERNLFHFLKNQAAIVPLGEEIFA